MSIIEKILKLRLADINIFLKDFFKFNSHSLKIGKLNIEKIVLTINKAEFEEVKQKALETAKKIPEIAKQTIEFPDSIKEDIAKSIVVGTILINLPTLKEKTSKGLVSLDSDINVNLLIKCEKCGKPFNSGISGTTQVFMNSHFINNRHQCRNCGNMQLAKENSDYFVSFNLQKPSK